MSEEQQDTTKPEPTEYEKYMAEKAFRHRLMQKLTNWQRNQAGRACNGQFDKIPTADLFKFTRLTKG